MATFDEIDVLLAKAKEFTKDRPHGYAAGCTEWQAAWCSNHGDCLCGLREHGLNINPDCPLHNDEMPFRNAEPCGYCNGNGERAIMKSGNWKTVPCQVCNP